jgi:hypothetical protein
MRPVCSAEAPRIEMYGVKRRSVEELVAATGAEVVDVLEDGKAGRGWVSLRHCVVKL